MIVNILNHSNTHKKKIPNFCQITPTSYLKGVQQNMKKIEINGNVTPTAKANRR